MAGVALLMLALLGWSSGASASPGLISNDDASALATAPLFQISKRDLEFNQYVPAYRLRGEPSCEELRAMWRLSKREARRATSTNHLPRTRAYRYGRLRSFAPSSAYGSRAANYGTINYNDGHRHQYRLPQHGKFNKLRAMMGGRASRPGLFGEMRDIINKERAPSETSRGKFDKLRGMVLKEYQNEDEAPIVRTLRSGGGGSSSARGAQYQLRGFTGHLLPGDSRQVSAQDPEAASARSALHYDSVTYYYYYYYY